LINLDNNKIGDEGTKHISKMHSLRELYLGNKHFYVENNGITNYGAAALCRIPSLEIINLSSNKIGND
jgi:hypothetical protein